MTQAEFRPWLKGLLMGLARGPVDESIIRMIEDNLPAGRVRVEPEFDVPPPPPTDDPEAALEQESQPGYITPEQIKNMKRGVAKAPPKPLPAPLRRRPAGTKVGTDEDLRDAASGGEVLRLG